MKAAFVILHYLVPEVTRTCVNLLLSNFPKADIVVVDNASPDGSGPQLKAEYLGKEGNPDSQSNAGTGAINASSGATNARLHFILLPENQGFARGNNAGYEYAVKNLDPDFVIVLNNDVMVTDADFLDKVQAEYERKNFAVLGPDIFVPSSSWHQSPARLHPMSMQEVQTLRFKMATKYRFHTWHYLTWNLKLALGLARQESPKDKDYTREHEDCVLQGACYIFSREFTSVRKYAFNPATFMYTEEDILKYECDALGLSMRYCPSLSVEHLEDAATNSAFRSGIRRSKVKYGRLVQSLDVLLSIMKAK